MPKPTDYTPGSWQETVAKILVRGAPFSTVKEITDPDEYALALSHLEGDSFPHLITEDEKAALEGRMPAEEIAMAFSTGDFDLSMIHRLREEQPELTREADAVLAVYKLTDEIKGMLESTKPPSKKRIGRLRGTYGDIRTRELIRDVSERLGYGFDDRYPFSVGSMKFTSSLREDAHLPLNPTEFLNPSGTPSLSRLSRTLKSYYGRDFNVDTQTWKKDIEPEILKGISPGRAILERYGAPVSGEKALTEENLAREEAERAKTIAEAREEKEAVEELPRVPLEPLAPHVTSKKRVAQGVKVALAPQKVIKEKDLKKAMPSKKKPVPAVQKTLAEFEKPKLPCVMPEALELFDYISKELEPAEAEEFQRILKTLPMCKS